MEEEKLNQDIENRFTYHKPTEEDAKANSEKS